MELFAQFPRFLHYFRGLEMGFPAFEMPFKNKETKFHIKVRKPDFKLWKALFKKGSERNFKNKNVLEFEVEKDGGIIS